MAQGIKGQRSLLTKVTIRLFSEDVRRLKALAAPDFVPWHAKARSILHDALLHPRRGRIVQ